MNETTFGNIKPENIKLVNEAEMPQAFVDMEQCEPVSKMETATVEMQPNVVVANNAIATEEKVAEFPQPVEEVKPYRFGRFTSADVFPMFKILGKIGINEFTTCFEKDGIKDLIASFTSENKGEDIQSMVGVSVVLEAVNVILGNLPKCEQDIYKILSQTSNLTVDEVKGLDLAVFTEMIIDFVQKDDFKDFFKVVSKLFK